MPTTNRRPVAHGVCRVGRQRGRELTHRKDDNQNHPDHDGNDDQDGQDDRHPPGTLRCFNRPGNGIIAIVITIAIASGARMKAIPRIPQTTTKTAAKPSNSQMIDDDFVFTAPPEDSQQSHDDGLQVLFWVAGHAGLCFHAMG